MNIILNDGQEQNESKGNDVKKETPVKPNLFQGRTEAGADNAKFPAWDIVPPYQFINPRIKKQ